MQAITPGRNPSLPAAIKAPVATQVRSSLTNVATAMRSNCPIDSPGQAARARVCCSHGFDRHGAEGKYRKRTSSGVTTTQLKPTVSASSRCMQGEYASGDEPWLEWNRYRRAGSTDPAKATQRSNSLRRKRRTPSPSYDEEVRGIRESPSLTM